MRLLPAIFAFVLTVGCGAPPVPEPDPGPSPEEDRAALLAADSAWSETAGDVAAFTAYYAPDARFLAPEAAEPQGVAAIEESITAMFALPNFSLSWTSGSADVSGDLGYTVGTFELTAGEEPATRTGHYVAVWRRQVDGSWKVVVDAPVFDAPTGEE